MHTSQAHAETNLLFRWRSYLPLLIIPLILLSLPQAVCLERWTGERIMDVWECFCIALMLAALVFRGWAVGHAPSGTSGRETRQQRANSLNTTGLYSATRNPLYVANTTIYVAIAMYTGVWWVAALAILVSISYFGRIIEHEEAFLSERFGEGYQSWAAITPRFWPSFSHWRPWETPFLWRKLIRREYPGWFGATLTLAIVDMAEDSVDTGSISLDYAWIAAVIVTGALYLVARTMKKRGMLRSH